MKIDFPILWLDDNAQFVDSHKAPLIQWMDEQGFALLVNARTNAGSLDNDLHSDVELIVLDFHMPGSNGDAIIERIRKKQCYQDIIFYSQDDLSKAQFASPPDGVFFVHKQD